MKIWWKRGDGQKKAYCLHAFAGALYNLYISWAVNGYKETPEEMARLISKLISTGMTSVYPIPYGQSDDL